LDGVILLTRLQIKPSEFIERIKKFTIRAGFIEFIVEPSMGVCSDMLDYILAPLNASNSGTAPPSTTSIVEEGSE
jgi:hypothetical protein